MSDILSHWWVCEQCHEQFHLHLPVGTSSQAYRIELYRAHGLVAKSDCTNTTEFHNDTFRDGRRERLDEFLDGLAAG